MMNVNTAADTGSYYMDFGSNTRDMIIDTTTSANLRQCADYTLKPGARVFSRYIRLSKFWKQKNLTWLSTAVNYPDAGTLLRQHTTGFANNAILGKLHCTWYVKWRGIRTV